MLSINDHRRDSAGMRYIYPVVSRRAGGVSIGINLNVNNACNWACIYCQVPELKRGGPAKVDLHQLESELHDFLQEAIAGNFLKNNAPDGFQQLVDIAFSGNGEPTSAREFPEARKPAYRLRVDHQRQPDQTDVRTKGGCPHRRTWRRGMVQNRPWQ